MNKQQALDNIAQEIENCQECKIGKSGKAVPGEGNPDADVVFIGEAPGKTEAKTGRPFIGRSGQLLRSLIREAGLKEEDVYITSPVKYLPDRGTPTPKDVEHGRTHFLKQLEIIDPKVLVLLGSVAVQGVLGEKLPVKKEHGKVIERNGKKYLLTLHPAAGLRFPPLKKLILEDFSKLPSLLIID
jgi:uracil-DNA glycosylase family 4